LLPPDAPNSIPAEALPQTPLTELTTPDPLAGFKGTILWKGRGRAGNGMGKGSGRDKGEGKEGGEEKGRQGEGGKSVYRDEGPLTKILNTPLIHSSEIVQSFGGKSVNFILLSTGI